MSISNYKLRQTVKAYHQQLGVEYFTILYTAISRKVVGKNVHATIPEGNMGYDRYTVPDDCSCRTYFVPFRQRSQTHFHGLSCQFFQISLKNRELKTTHNAFQDCRVHFSRQPFSKQLYGKSKKASGKISTGTPPNFFQDNPLL